MNPFSMPVSVFLLSSEILAFASELAGIFGVDVDDLALTSPAASCAWAWVGIPQDVASQDLFYRLLGSRTLSADPRFWSIPAAPAPYEAPMGPSVRRGPFPYGAAAIEERILARQEIHINF